MSTLHNHWSNLRGLFGAFATSYRDSAFRISSVNFITKLLDSFFALPQHIIHSALQNCRHLRPVRHLTCLLQNPAFPHVIYFCSDTKASGMYFAQGHAFIVEHNAQPTTCDRRYVGKIRQVEHMFDNCMIVVVTRGATRIFHICAPGDDAA